MTISAKIILDSYNSDVDSRVTTAQLVIHRFVLAELNTHRAFSRNSASSRAIPVKKQIKQVMENPAIPLSWPAEQSGMQGGEPLNALAHTRCEALWMAARTVVVDVALQMAQAGLHKSVINRLLEPWLWHSVIVTSTEAGWQNFFAQRCSPLAQPEMKAVADLMQAAYRASVPTNLDHGYWHLPYVTGYDADEMPDLETAKACSAARCARVSYETHDGVKDIAKDLQLFNRLINPGDGPMHASPFEHVCTPSSSDALYYGPVPGNLAGWNQWRHALEDESLKRSDTSSL